LAAVVWPATVAGKTVVSYTIINPTGTGNFVGGTTALDDGTVVPNAVYVPVVGPFDPKTTNASPTPERPMKREDLEAMTKDELREHAEGQGVELAALDTKGTMVDKILGEYVAPATSPRPRLAPRKGSRRLAGCTRSTASR
jgi:hypothetical protein